MGAELARKKKECRNEVHAGVEVKATYFFLMFALPRYIYKPSISNKPSFIQRLFVFCFVKSYR